VVIVGQRGRVSLWIYVLFAVFNAGMKNPNAAGGRRSRTPYRWLGAGALTLGVGAALAGGAGVAHADVTAVDSASASVSGQVQDRGAVNRATRPASVSGGGAVRSVALTARASAASPARALVGARTSEAVRPQQTRLSLPTAVATPAASSSVEEVPSAAALVGGDLGSPGRAWIRRTERGQARPVPPRLRPADPVFVIDDLVGVAQTWIEGLRVGPVRNSLQDVLELTRRVALSAVGVQLGATPACVSAGGDCSGQDFSGQNLSGLYALDVDFTGALFVGTNLDSATLAYADLTRANLTQADLTYADLRGADLTGANLTRADLTYADLRRGADLTDANLTYAYLGGANLTGADLTRANLTMADLSVADLSYANLYLANLTGADLTGVTWNRTICPDGTATNNAERGSCTA